MNDSTKLSPDEQKVYDRWKNVCEKNFNSLKPSVQFSCVIQKKQLEQDAQLKQQAMLNEARIQFVHRQIEALMYVLQTVDARQIEATLLLAALMRASGEYDQILAARAAAPIALDIIFGLATSFLPEAKLLGRLAKRYTSSVKTAYLRASVWRAMAGTVEANSWQTLATDIMEVTAAKLERRIAIAGKIEKVTEKFAHTIDSASKHMVDAIQHPLEANKKVDEATRERLAAWKSKNQILSDIIRDINRTLAAVATFEPILFRLILWYEGADIVNLIKKKFIDADLDSPATNNPADYDALEDLILYDMLRLYTKQNFVVSGVYERTPIDDMPDQGTEALGYHFEGLDEAQREMIYNRFGKVRWQDATRPAVHNYRDLLKYWGGTVQRVGDRPFPPR
jgi:hypothetical protein